MSNRRAEKRVARDAAMARGALTQFVTLGFFGRLRWLLFGIRRHR